MPKLYTPRVIGGLAPTFPGVRVDNSILPIPAPTGGTNAYGSYVEVTAGLAYDSFLYMIQDNTLVNSARTYHTVILSCGTAGNERIISQWKFAPNGGNTATNQPSWEAGQPLMFPVFIPAGTRLSMAAANNASRTSTFTLGFVDARAVPSGWWPWVVSTVDCPGIGYVDNAEFTAPTVTSAAAWVALSGNPFPYDVYLTGASIQAAAQNGYCSFGIGVAGSEVPITPILYGASNQGSGRSAPGTIVVPYPVLVPAGTEMFIKHTATNASVVPQFVRVGALVPNPYQ